jgi:hypothetical protein
MLPADPSPPCRPKQYEINCIEIGSNFHKITKKLPIYAPDLMEAHGKYSAEKSIKNWLEKK